MPQPSHRCGGRGAIGLVLLFFFTLGMGQAGAADLLSGGDWYIIRPSEGAAAYELKGQTLHITIHQATDPLWSIQIGREILPDVPIDSRVRLRFRGRSSTGNSMRVVIETAGPPYSAFIEQSPRLTDQWQDFDLTAVSSGYPKKGLALRFQVGQQAGQIEISDVQLENLGPDPDSIAAQEAIKPEAIAERIERYRKGELSLIVRDAAGRPAPGVTVQVTQTRHAFRFGANIFNLNPKAHDPIQEAYQQRFAALLNYATLPFYWGAFEPRKGRTDDARLREMALWCRDHGIEVKGHPLVWHEVYPSWAPNDPDQTIALLHNRVTETIDHFRDCVHIWDVVNEANTASQFKNGVGAWARRDGPAVEVGTSLDWARQAGTGTGETFTYNDYNTGSANIQLLTDLQARHQLPDVIGIQSHMHDANWPITRVWRTAATFAKFGLPIHFTETTVVSGEHRPPDTKGPSATNWFSTPQGEAEQADYLEQFYSVLFSHPAVQAITYWDFSDYGAWLGAPAGMLRKDMTPKPSYDRLMRLIHHDWWTDVRGATSADGGFTTRAFYGEYQITARDAAGHVAVTNIDFKPGEKKSVELKLSQ